MSNKSGDVLECNKAKKSLIVNYIAFEVIAAVLYVFIYVFLNKHYAGKLMNTNDIGKITIEANILIVFVSIVLNVLVVIFTNLLTFSNKKVKKEDVKSLFVTTIIIQLVFAVLSIIGPICEFALANNITKELINMSVTVLGIALGGEIIKRIICLVTQKVMLSKNVE